ncbi:filamentous hemagglutinin N-terminal domain-containing protein, partial [Salmonella enterica subsp. salamae]|nr:filamentous hemagglutinin N-terminal domain-containing protein [Salmonella enterica subsp. salamae]
MNKIYKLKFDKRRNELVAVSELTAGTGKEKSTGQVAALSGIRTFRQLLGTLTPLAFLTGLAVSLLPGLALAADLPAGGQIVGGRGSISTAGNQMTIHQQTQNMAASWQSFDIGKNHTVQFVQPDSSSVALNRVTGASASRIMGNLNANGKVFLVNPNGVLFGKGASVNTAGLVASTKHISTADFMKGNYTFSGGGVAGAEVVNQGSLTTTKGGFIVLAADRVSNRGTITTPSGKAVLAAADKVTLTLDRGGLTSVVVNGSVANALVENRGLMSATDGQVYLTARGKDMLLNTVVNNSGTLEASGLTANGGVIHLDGGDHGVVTQAGQILADSHAGQGGKIILEGQNIHLAGNSLTSATGKTGGGEVYAGGGWQGKDSHIKNASKVVMGQGATVDVSAREAGSGGTAVLWSDDYTNVRGTVLAKGGTQSGNGGRVETSSHHNLQVAGTVDVSARAGQGGSWLLDPTDVSIVGTGTDTGSDSATTDNTTVFSPTAVGAQILNTTLSDALNKGGNVTVRTSGRDTGGQTGNITVNAGIAKTAGGDASLTLAADGNITVNQNITTTVGKLDISLLGAGSDRGTVSVQNSNLTTGGGNITLGQLAPVTTGTDGSSVMNPNDLMVNASNSTLDTTATAGTAGGIRVQAHTSQNNAFAVSLSGTKATAGGDVALSATSSAGSYSALNLACVTLSSQTGNITFDLDSGTTKSHTLKADGGASTLTAQRGDVLINVTTHPGTYRAITATGMTVNAVNISITGTGEAGNTGFTGGLLNATGNIDIATSTGLTLNGMQVKSGGDINVTGTGSGGLLAMAGNGAMQAAGDITVLVNSLTFSQSGANRPDLNATAGNITLSLVPGAGGVVSGPVKATAGKDVIISAESASLNGVLDMSGSDITAGRDIRVSATPLRGSNNNDSLVFRNAALTARQALSLDAGKGESGNIFNGVSLNNVTLGAPAVTVQGVTRNNGKAGVMLSGVTLNGSHATITGQGLGSGQGFSLSNITLQGMTLGDLTLSSAGSDSSLINSLDGSLFTGQDGVVNHTLLDELMAKHPENMTRIDMGGIPVFNDSTKGWTADYSNADTPTGGWIFGNTTVTAGGDVSLKGAGFDHASVTIGNGSLNMSSGGSVVLTDTVVKATDGGVVLHSHSGNVDLTHGNISAKNDITLTADNGKVIIAGTNATDRAGITSTAGNISVNVTTMFNRGAWLTYTNLDAHRTILLTANVISDPANYGAYIGGVNTFSATETRFDIVNNGHGNTYSPVYGITFGQNSDTTFNGNAVINARAETGIFFEGNGGQSVTSYIHANGGVLDINATGNSGTATGGGPTGAIAIDNYYLPNTVVFDLNNADVNIIADASESTANVPGFAASTRTGDFIYPNAYKFTGIGNVSVTGKSNKWDGVNLRDFSNKDLTGSMNITGISNDGIGVNVDGLNSISAEVVNATIKGSSGTGIGILVNTDIPGVSSDISLGNNTLIGVSDTSSGVTVKGNNITITNGTLSGTSG